MKRTLKGPKLVVQVLVNSIKVPPATGPKLGRISITGFAKNIMQLIMMPNYNRLYCKHYMPAIFRLLNS